MSAHCVKPSMSVVISRAKRRFSRSAESWIGVSGFLISCAIRRATSAQAALRCAESSSVTSSKVTTNPPATPFLSSAPIRTSSTRLPIAGPCSISPVAGRSGAAITEAISCANYGTTSAKGWLILASRSTRSSSAAARFGSSIRPTPSRPITPAETPASTVSVKRRRSSS